MDACIEIYIYGGQSLLATLKKQQALSECSYTKESVIERIYLTPQVSTEILLNIPSIVFNEKSNTLITETSQLQVTEIISVLGKSNFISFLQQTESHGWKISKYIDIINHYFHHDYQTHSLPWIGKTFKYLLQALLIITLLILPALFILFTKNQYITNPFTEFALFLSITILTSLLCSILCKKVGIPDK